MGCGVDDDGILGQPDLFLGAADGSLRYFTENTYPEIIAGNPFDGINFGAATLPAFVNFDGDGDFDLVLGTGSGEIRYLENTGTSMSPDFEERFGGNNPLNINAAGPVVVRFTDFDGDRDQDAVVAEGTGNLRYFENVGDTYVADFQERFGAQNPLSGLADAERAIPAFADLDDDGDEDLLLGRNGNLRYFERGSGGYVEQSGPDSPFDNWSVGSNAAPFFHDQDGDGDFDLFIGTGSGSISYYNNTGSPTEAGFIITSGAANPMDGISAAGDAVPFLIDIDDEDGDDATNFRGPTDPRVRYTINRLHGHQAKLEAVEAFVGQILSLESLDGRNAYNDFLANEAAGVPTILSVTNNISGENGHVIVPYAAETKSASSHSATVTINAGSDRVNITGTGSFAGFHEHTTITIPGAGDGTDLETTIVRVLSATEVEVSDDATNTASNATATWDVPQRHYIYVYDSNLPYQDPAKRVWYDMDTNIVIVNASTGEWRYRKSTSTTIWPEDGDDGHLTTLPLNLAAPKGRTPASMGLDVVSLAAQVIVHGEGAVLEQVTDGQGRRLFVPGTRRLDLDPETGLRCIVPVVNYGGDGAKSDSRAYMVVGKRPDELRFTVSGPNGYSLDLADARNRIRVTAAATAGSDELVIGRNGNPSLVLPAARETARYTVKMNHLSRPGKVIRDYELVDLRTAGSLTLSLAADNSLSIEAPETEARYRLHASLRTPDGERRRDLGKQIQEAGSRRVLEPGVGANLFHPRVQERR